VKLDLHVRTLSSGHTTIRPLARCITKSYNTPHGVYRRARAGGMDARLPEAG
jgi:hypothetical protein